MVNYALIAFKTQNMLVFVEMVLRPNDGVWTRLDFGHAEVRLRPSYDRPSLGSA